MFPEPTELLLVGLFDRINLDPKIQIKYINTKNQLEDILTKGNFTRDEWKHLLCLFNISHFSSINSLEAMSKRTQEDAGEERVTAKSKPMMNLTARMPSVVSSSTTRHTTRTLTLAIRDAVTPQHSHIQQQLHSLSISTCSLCNSSPCLTQLSH